MEKVAERVVWADFGHIKKSASDRWTSLLLTDASFVEELAVAFGEWLKAWENPAREHWDDEKIYLNSLDLRVVGFWEKMPVETFLARFKADIDPDIAEAVRMGAAPPS